MPVPDSSALHGVVYYSLLANNLESDSEDTEKIMEGKKYYIESNQNHNENMMNGTQNNCNYNILQENECENRNNIINHDSDRIAILDGGSADGMSPVRKLCFILSIMLIIITVFVFLWIIPCDDMSCSAKKDLKTQNWNWNRNFEKIELKGRINVEVSSKRYGKNLIFMFRSDKVFPDFKNKKPRNGVLALLGNSGQVSWYIEMINEPRSLDCSLIDANNDNIKDCLLLDEFGQVGCINAASGKWIFYKNVHESKRMAKRSDLLDFPLVLPDINGDGINDLLLASTNGEDNHNSLIVISGADGTILHQQKKNCLYIHKLQIDPDFTVKYICMMTENSEQQILQPLSEILAMSRKDFDSKKFLSPGKINQHKFFGQRRNTESQRTINSVRGKQLIIENKGKCPKNCTVSIQLLNESTKKVLWNFTASQMYSMVPVVFNSSSAKVKAKSALHGFIVKFWHWNGTDSSYNVEKNRFKRDLNLKDVDSDDFDVFSKLMKKKKDWILPTNAPYENGEFHLDDGEDKRRKRDVKYKSNYTNQTFANNTLFKTKMRFLKETILLIVFNSTDMRIENTSQNSIVQFCQKSVTSRTGIKKDKKNEESLCQPDLNFQENSLLIADLDDDGEQELVSYFTTFVNENEGGAFDKWKLKTRIQLLRLESELPKLYTSLENI